MSHTFAFSGSTITIHVDPDGYSNTREPVMARHQILDTDHTTIQYLGSQSRQLALSFKVYGHENAEYIDERSRDGDLVVYTDDRAVSGSYTIMSLSSDRLNALNYNDNWYQCKAQMILLDDLGDSYYQT